MARGVNKVILVGSCGKDPETRYSQAGAAMTSVSVATNETWKDKVSGEKQERTEWHRVKFFGRLAEIAGEYLKKGSQVYIEGSLRTDKYTDKEGVERYSTDIIASEMQMLGGAPNGEGRGDRGASEQGTRSTGAQNQAPRGGSNGAQNSGAQNNGGNRNAGQPRREPELEGAAAGGGSRGGGGFGNFGAGSEPFPDDDIPFATPYSLY